MAASRGEGETPGLTAAPSGANAEPRLHSGPAHPTMLEMVPDHTLVHSKQLFNSDHIYPVVVDVQQLLLSTAAASPLQEGNKRKGENKSFTS